MNLKFLGGVREVGRSATLVKHDSSSLLFDYGVLVGEEPGFPSHVAPKDIGGIIISHAHLDHSGATPLFYVSDRVPLYATQLTLDLARLLIMDLLRLASYYLPFEYLDLETMLQSAIPSSFDNKWRKVGDLNFRLLNAGHIPGSVQALVKSRDGKSVLLTGDLNTKDTRLLSGAELPDEDLDAVVLESTYAVKQHEERGVLERRFVDRCREVIERGGTVLIPAFGVGRSQEILCVLKGLKFEYPVLMDGMAKDASKILMKYPRYLRDSDLFKRAMSEAVWVKGWKARRKALKEGKKVIVAPAGMLKGGIAAFCAEKMLMEKENAVFLVSYQIPGSPGHELLEKSTFIIDGEARKVEAKVEHFDFSSHCGEEDLDDFVKSLKGNPTVYTVHGEESSCTSFAERIEQNIGLKAIAPRAGEIYSI